MCEGALILEQLAFVHFSVACFSSSSSNDDDSDNSSSSSSRNRA